MTNKKELLRLEKVKIAEKERATGLTPGFQPKGITKIVIRRQRSTSRRNPMKVAWHEVPGNDVNRDPSRRVRYERYAIIQELPRGHVL